MTIVTIFISVPFVIREVGPVLQELGTEEEEASVTLGASSFQTFLRVTMPNIKWGVLYGAALGTARALGEIGAVLIVSGAIVSVSDAENGFRVDWWAVVFVVAVLPLLVGALALIGARIRDAIRRPRPDVFAFAD